MPKADLFTCASCDAQVAEDVVVCGTCAIHAHKQHTLEPYVRATQRNIDEARRTVEDHLERAESEYEEAKNLIEEFLELTARTFAAKVSELRMHRTRLDACSDATKDDLANIVQASAQKLATTEEAVSMIRFTLNGLIREIAGGTNDDILNNAFDEDVDFASDVGSAIEEESFWSPLFDDFENGRGRRHHNSESSTSSP